MPYVDGPNPRHAAGMRTQVPGADALVGFDADFGPLAMGYCDHDSG